MTLEYSSSCRCFSALIASSFVSWTDCSVQGLSDVQMIVYMCFSILKSGLLSLKLLRARKKKGE